MSKESQLEKSISKTYMVDLDPKEGGDAFSAVQIEDIIPEKNVVKETADVVDEETAKKEKEDAIVDAQEEEQEDQNEDIEEEQENEEDEDGDEEDDDQEDEEVEVDIDDINVYYHLGDQLKKDGILGEDAEIDEDITPVEVYELYKTANEAQLRQELTSAVMKELEEEGVTQSDLMYARAIRQGVDVRLLSAASTYERYGSADIEKMSDSEKLEVVKSMHKFRGFTDTESSKIINAEDFEKDDSLVKDAISYHKSQFTKFVQEENQRADNRDKLIKKQQADTEKQINNILSKRELLGESITAKEAKILKDSIYAANKIVKVDDTSYRVTELQEFLIDFQKSPELKLYLFNKYRNRNIDKTKLKRKMKDEVEQEILSGLGAKVKKDSTSKKTTRKKVKRDSEDSGRIIKQYHIDLSTK